MRTARERRVWPLLEACTAVLLLAVAFVGLLNTDGLRGGPRVDFGQPPRESGMDLVDLHLTERNESYAYRWTSDYTFAQIPHGYNAAQSYIATARIRAANPAGPQPLTLLGNERPLATVTPSTDFRTYRVLLPRAPTDDDAAVRFALQTTPFTSTVDSRKLGVMMTSIALEPMPFTGWGSAALLALALGGLWLWLRWRGASFGATLLVWSMLVGGLLALSALYQPAPLTFPLLALLALGGAALGIALARELASWLALAALALLVSFSGVLWPSWLTDDALISFRYAQNLVAGNGLVYNVGERVEGYTNFLWTMLAALVLALGGNPVWWSYLAGVALALAILLLTYWMARRVLGPAWSLVAALFVATSQSLLIYTVRGAGLETGLFTLLVLAGSALVLTMDDGRRKIGDREILISSSPHLLISSSLHLVTASLILALATMTRPEGALVFALTFVVVLFLGDRRQGTGITVQSAIYDPSTSLRTSLQSAIPMLATYLVIFVPYFLWRYSYYGEWLPNTFYAKTGGGLRQIVRGLDYAGEFALAFGGPLLLLALAPTIILYGRSSTAAHFLDRSNNRPGAAAPLSSIVYRLSSVVRSWRGYLLLLVGVYSAYIIVVGGDHFPGERFFVPLVPWLAILLADGLAWAYGWLQRTLPMRALAPGLLAAMLLLYSGWALERTNLVLTRPVSVDTVLRGNDESVWIWRELGWWLRDHAAPGESVAALGAGAIPYYSDHPTVDLLGLNDKHIARVSVATIGTGAAGHEKRDPDYVLNVRQPTYLPRIWDEYFGGEQALRGQYELVTIRTRYGREMELWKRRP